MEIDSSKMSRQLTSGSYRDHIKQMALTLCREPYLWLDDFLSARSEKPNGTSVSILDSVKGQFHPVHNYEGGRFANDLKSALQCHPLEVTTRIIVVEHGGYKTVDREIINTVFSAFNVDPLFVMSHFYWDSFEEGEKHKPPLSGCPPVSLPSLVTFLSLDYHGQFSGILLEDITPRTVLILVTSKLWGEKIGYDHGHRAQIQGYCYGQSNYVATPESHNETYKALMPLLHLDTDAIHEADLHIIEYFHPYALFLAANFGSEVFSLEREIQKISEKYPTHSLSNEDVYVEGALEEIKPVITDFHRLRVSLDRCCHHLSQFIEKHPGSLKMINLLNDYKTIAHHAEEFERNTRLSTQLWIGLADAEEARESRIEAFQVRILTILAFIFVPLDFIANFFGLNFDAVSDAPKAVKFGITAGVTVIMLLLSLICILIVLKFTETSANRSRSNRLLGRPNKTISTEKNGC